VQAVSVAGIKYYILMLCNAHTHPYIHASYFMYIYIAWILYVPVSYFMPFYAHVYDALWGASYFMLFYVHGFILFICYIILFYAISFHIITPTILFYPILCTNAFNGSILAFPPKYSANVILFHPISCHWASSYFMQFMYIHAISTFSTPFCKKKGFFCHI